jgi:hypothetical protein
MWIIALILSIKLNMPTWYWIIFTVITILRPIACLFEDELKKQLIDKNDK